MARYQSIYSGKAATKDNPFADDFRPGQYYVKSQPKPKQSPVQEKPKPQSRSLFSKISSGAKGVAKAATAGEQKFAEGIARTLPGGTNDIKAEARASEQAANRIKQVQGQVKAGKMKPEAAKKIIKINSEGAGEASKNISNIVKSLPTKKQIALGAASTAADILTAGTLKAGRVGLASAKGLKPVIAGTTRGAKAIRGGSMAAGYGTAGALNTAAAGGNKKQIAENFVAGAALPGALHVGAKAAQIAHTKAVNSILDQIRAPKQLLENAKTQAVINAAREKEVAKAAIDTQKIEQKIELVNAKKADGKFTNVDKVKVKQLEKQKQELAAPTATAPVTKAENTINVNGEDYQLSGKALEEYQAAKAIHDQTVDTFKNYKDAFADSQRKRAGMQLSAVKRKVTGNLTAYERSKAGTAKPKNEPLSGQDNSPEAEALWEDKYSEQADSINRQRSEYEQKLKAATKKADKVKLQAVIAKLNKQDAALENRFLEEANKSKAPAAETPTKPQPQLSDTAAPAKPKTVKSTSLPDNSKQLPGAKTPFDTPEIIKKRAEQENITSTHTDMSPERVSLREKVGQLLYQQGGHADANKAPYKINTNRRADIVLGPPASGKTNIVDPLLTQHKSRLIDSDEAKGLLGDVNQAGALHQESDAITTDQMLRAAKRGDNIVLPLVGKNPERVRAAAHALKEAGYDLHLHYNHLDPELTAQRAVSRFEETGRFVDPHYVYNEVGLKPKASYDILKKDGRYFKTYKAYDNNVAKGEKPRLIEDSRLRTEPDKAGRPLRGSTGKEAQKPQEKSLSSSKANKYGIKPSSEIPKTSAPKYKNPSFEGKLTEEVAQDYPSRTAFIKETAKGYYDLEKSFKGGTLIDKTGVNDAYGSGRMRITEHGQFYRQFYAEHKKAPTLKDYEAAVKQEFETGRGNVIQDQGEHDIYQLINDRIDGSKARVALGDHEPTEGRSLLSAGRITDASATKSQVPTDRGISKVGQSIQEKAVKRGLKSDFGEAAGYNKITIEDQAKKAVALTNDRLHLEQVINDEVPLPDGLRATALIKAVEEHPVLGKDAALLNRLSAAEHLSGKSSQSAQELRLAAERGPVTPVEAMRKIREARLKATERRLKKSASQAVSDEVKQIRAAKPKVQKETFESFVESLRC